MLRMRFSTWRVGILASLFPALLLLPTLHLHPAYDHAHGTHGAHKHAAVVHADFLPASDLDHAEHQQDHSESGDPSSRSLAQIGFPTVPPRSFILLTPALEKAPVFLSAAALVFSSPFLFPTRIPTRDHSPPIQNHSFPPVSPRSPPLLT